MVYNISNNYDNKNNMGSYNSKYIQNNVIWK
jgi:hypothetical protein